METITYSQVQDLVQHLPPPCLPAAYEMLRELTDRSETLQSQIDFMHLPLAKRHATVCRFSRKGIPPPLGLRGTRLRVGGAED